MLASTASKRLRLLTRCWPVLLEAPAAVVAAVVVEAPAEAAVAAVARPSGDSVEARDGLEPLAAPRAPARLQMRGIRNA
jgi:hypothetical protein